MASVLNKQVGEFSLMDGVLITGAKVGSEEALSRFPLVGNGTYKSGAIKTLIAFGLSMLSKNKYLQYTASGVLIDGLEDIIVNIKTHTQTQTTSKEVIL